MEQRRVPFYQEVKECETYSGKEWDKILKEIEGKGMTIKEIIMTEDLPYNDEDPPDHKV